MADITIIIPNDKLDKAKEGFLYLYPNREMTDDETPVAKYTDNQWIKEKIRRNLVRDIYRGLNMKAQRASVLTQDNEIAS